VQNFVPHTVKASNVLHTWNGIFLKFPKKTRRHRKPFSPPPHLTKPIFVPPGHCRLSPWSEVVLLVQWLFFFCWLIQSGSWLCLDSDSVLNCYLMISVDYCLGISFFFISISRKRVESSYCFRNVF
jgi:hypothetical protein